MSEQIVYSNAFDTLDTDWRWLRENPDHWRRVDGGLEIRVEPSLADTVINALLRSSPDRSTSYLLHRSNSFKSAYTHPTVRTGGHHLVLRR